MNDANNLVDKMLLALESVFYGENSRISYKPEYEELKRFIYFTAPFAGAREIERLQRELALKDADLLLERDRAEKAEKELSEANICEQCDGNTEGVQFCAACWNRLATQMLKSQSQVKMLVETLNAVVNTHSFIQIKVMVEEVLAKIKEEEHICAYCGAACGSRYPIDTTEGTDKVDFLCCECAA